ncbi:hypothetical protein ACIGO6_31270 [Streptomyces sp. NPDC053750]|uniref:hypothetical protein n=1 Tax=Streptomyces sp. NPDC053750 TaxID=3365714 RepID=UPI0037D24D9F
MRLQREGDGFAVPGVVHADEVLPVDRAAHGADGLGVDRWRGKLPVVAGRGDGERFTSVTGSAVGGAPALPDYGHALGIVLIVSAALYLVTALVMLALPKATGEHGE